MLFDSHCHLHFSQYDSDREEVINRLKEASVKVINIGTDLEDSKKAIDLAKKYFDFMWASVGVHPNDTDSEIDFEELKKITSDEKVVAVGECGLDYFRTPGRERQAKQREIFEKQIELAKELNKPLILHCRSSAGSQNVYDDTIDILNSNNANNGVAHFFAGSKEIAKKFLDLGFYIGFAGPITFAEEYKELVEFVPLDRILIETDAPFAAPVPHRGQRNEPIYVEFVARKIAEWKNLKFEEVTRQTAKNANSLFRIKLP
jgi:TatD DNase family protein